jgi:hypothetical protein
MNWRLTRVPIGAVRDPTRTSAYRMNSIPSATSAPGSRQRTDSQRVWLVIGIKADCWMLFDRCPVAPT